MTVAIKICGINSGAALDAVVRARAEYAGFMLFPRSPRHIEPQIAAQYVARLPAGVKSVVPTVNADDALIDIICEQIRPDYIQAHGKESPARIAEITRRSGLPVIKALPIATRGDLEAVDAYAPVAEMFLFDAKPPKGADRPGGFGHAFDWQILAGYRGHRPWFLAGGLNAANVAEAIEITMPPAVDVSSGVESQSGVKDPQLIAKFVAAVHEPRSATVAGHAEQEERT